MSTLARQILGAPKKRKEPAESFKPPPKRREPPKPTSKPPTPKSAPKPSPLGRADPPALPAKNRLLAGYLAHEFLTKGTLLGQPFGPAGAEPAKPAVAVKVEQPLASYAELAYLLKFDGTHVPGIVNPTQLGCWIQKGGGGAFSS